MPDTRSRPPDLAGTGRARGASAASARTDKGAANKAPIRPASLPSHREPPLPLRGISHEGEGKGRVPH
jgi:hypothetical protein